MKVPGKISMIRALVTLAAALALIGCSDKITNTDGTAEVVVSISARPSAPGAANAVDHYVLLVEGRDFGSLYETMSPEGNAVVARVTVPVGANRRFVASALDRANTVLYSGETISNVTSRATTSLTIVLYPMVPMLNLTPHFQRLVMGQGFAVEVNAFSIRNLHTYSFTCNYPTRDGIVTLDSVLRGRDLDSNSQIAWESGPGAPGAGISIYRRDQVGTLVDPSGDAHLATLYFSSHDSTAVDVDIAAIWMEPTSLMRLSGASLDTIPRDSVKTDGAAVELYRIMTWELTFGGGLVDVGNKVVETPDRNYVIVGTTGIFPGDYVYLIQTDRHGHTAWSKTFGARQYNEGQALSLTPDGGCIIVGHSQTDGPGTEDVYVVKTDGQGNQTWGGLFGGTYADFGNDAAVATDNGYFVVGATNSFGAGGLDVYLLKFNSLGSVIWQKTFGGPFDDDGFAVVALSDGGCVAAGWTNSSGTENTDLYLVKTDSAGNKVWEKVLGGPEKDIGSAMIKTADGGFLISGYTTSFGVEETDAYLLKTDAGGNLLWQRTYGGAGRDDARAVAATPDGGYILVGSSTSAGADYSDVYLVKTGPSGNLQWERRIGGPGNEAGMSVIATSDRHYVIAGSIAPASDIFNADLYFLKVDSLGRL